ncbi:unnamed protein product [Sphenostylis stenocarpa]|uniref:Uncharacterized protein n=1 Tax=Sphenostylis stenocarpa TaxID=92480 RepID=A0AA86SK92_9FABA|nr:unnamed protein product [Sphenostylis stenocarpa]
MTSPGPFRSFWALDLSQSAGFCFWPCHSSSLFSALIKSMIHDAGPYKGFLIMHVTSSKVTMVNPLKIGRCDQKEAISGSEIGADNSPGVVAAAAGASF